MGITERRKEEFYCQTECGKYFDTYLRTNMTGQYTIECPNCGHHHHRVITEGFVTGDRCNQNAAQLHILKGLKATLRDVPWHNSPENKRSRFKRAK